MPFAFQPLSLTGCVLVAPKMFPDDRGYFLESFKASDFAAAGLPEHFPQDNVSFSRRGVIRGLHYQKFPAAQGKLVSVLHGRIWDVAVDVRRRSPNFLKWLAVELDAEKRAMLYLPPGFAHGFLALTEDVLVHYKCTCEYDPHRDTGIRWDDPDIGIAWPTDAPPIVSEKDRSLPRAAQAELL